MPLVDLKQKWSDDESTASRSGTTDSRSSVRSWTATGDSAADTVEEIRSQSQLRLGQGLAGDSFATMGNLRCKRLAPMYYELSAVFNAEGEEAEDPTELPASVSFSFVATEEPIDEDVNGNAIVTDNDEPFDPPLTEVYYDLLIIFKKARLTYDPIQAWEYAGATNSDTYLGFPPGTCVMRPGSATEAEAGDIAYFDTTVEIQVRHPSPQQVAERVWWQRVRHEGFLELDTDGNGPDHAKDSTGNRVSSPVQLIHVEPDAGDNGKRAAAGDAYFKEFETKRKLPFSVIAMQ